jgi:type IV pilus assembly protein PilW
MKPAPHPAFHKPGAAGMTLVELMVGMAVGLFVATVAIATFVSTRTLNVVNASTTRMNENARLAMDLLHTDLRSSGFAGCRPLGQRQDDPPVTVLNGGVDSGFIATGASGLLGYKGTGTGFSPALSAKLTNLGTAAIPGSTTPVADSDIVSVRVPADTAALGVVGTMATTTAAPQLKPATADNPIVQGDVVLIANCESAAIFQVTEANPAATGVLSHAVGGAVAPGNASADLGHAFRSDATVYRLQTRHYYVAPSLIRPGTNSLWRLAVPATVVGPNPAEVANGVDRMVVDYGVDTDAAPDQNVNRYFDASGVANWDRVLTARLQMLVATPDNGMARAPQTVRFAGADVAATDRRIRTALTEVVTLRNGAP